MRFNRVLCVVCCLLCAAEKITCAQVVNWEEEPISYSTREPSRNPIARLQGELEQGKFDSEIPHTELGLLKRLLQELKIQVSSQVLVFSKTSLQAPHISPQTPRAVYFNDQVHVAYVQGGLIEVATADPDFGAVYYTLDPQLPQPRFTRQANRCLSCHAGSKTAGVPGFLVRSVFPDAEGKPVVRAGSSLSQQSTPLEKRWGGWYVTGTHGQQTHLGNYILQGDRKPKVIDNSAGHNTTSLANRFDTSKYLSPDSDIVALMVLEHQTEALNHLTRAIFQAQADEQIGPNDSAGPTQEEVSRELQAAVKPLVGHLLLTDELALTSPIVGSSSFTADFQRLGPFDDQGRSGRALQLENHIFDNPWSYLLHSELFAELSPVLQRAIAIEFRTELLEIHGDQALAAFNCLAPLWYQEALEQTPALGQ